MSPESSDSSSSDGTNQSPQEQLQIDSVRTQTVTVSQASTKHTWISPPDPHTSSVQKGEKQRDLRTEGKEMRVERGAEAMVDVRRRYMFPRSGGRWYFWLS